MNKIFQYDFQSFESERVKVDFISFNATKLSSSLQTSQIATYFQNLGFNCYFKNLESNKRREGCSNNHFQNKFELNIILNVPYQKEIMQIQFPGLSANQFYQLIKQKSIQWEKLKKFNIVLSRLDLVYERRKKLTDNISNTEFLESFYLEFTKLYLHRTIVSERNRKGLVLKVGNRKGQRYYRLYTSSENNSIRFEAEMKGDLIKKYHDFLTASTFDQQDFESPLLYEFFNYSFEIFRLSNHTSHVDWLINRLRPFQYKGRMISSEPNIHLHYLNQLDFNNLEEKQYLINFLKLIGFVRGLKYNTKKLKSTYRQFSFPLRDFLKHTNKNCNQYQLNKLKGFFDLVSKNFVIKSFTDTEYRMLVSIPDVHIYKSEQNIWNVDIWIAEELFDYLHHLYIINLEMITCI